MKKESWLIFVFCLLAGFIVAPLAQAHEPRLVPDNQLVLIKNPEVSQAFYGELKGHEAYYLIDLKETQDLYLQILVPDLSAIGKDKSVVVEYLSELGVKATDFAKLDAAGVDWQKYYEEYAGDNYWQGPDLKKSADSGYYLIKVTSPDNQGKYVLVVGEKEEFPVIEAAKALIIIPQLKKDFFQEPVSQWFDGKIGKYFSMGLMVLIIFVLMFWRFNRVMK